MTLANYFLIGWFNGYLDKYYLDSFKVYFSLIIVFSVLGNVSLTILRYRLSEKSPLGACTLSLIIKAKATDTDQAISVRELQVAFPPVILPGWYFSPRIPGSSLPFLRNRHDLGCDR